MVSKVCKQDYSVPVRVHCLHSTEDYDGDGAGQDAASRGSLGQERLSRGNADPARQDTFGKQGKNP